jgi:hypothetical protein
MPSGAREAFYVNYPLKPGNSGMLRMVVGSIDFPQEGYVKSEHFNFVTDSLSPT